MNNHESWHVCKFCGGWMDMRLSDICPHCKKINKNTVLKTLFIKINFVQPQS